jgi:hypothetical protein
MNPLLPSSKPGNSTENLPDSISYFPTGQNIAHREDDHINKPIKTLEERAQERERLNQILWARQAEPEKEEQNREIEEQRQIQQERRVIYFEEKEIQKFYKTDRRIVFEDTDYPNSSTSRSRQTNRDIRHPRQTQESHNRSRSPLIRNKKRNRNHNAPGTKLREVQTNENVQVSEEDCDPQTPEEYFQWKKSNENYSLPAGYFDCPLTDQLNSEELDELAADYRIWRRN